MFIDSAELEHRSVVNARVCIVGAGPAGITLARELAEAKVDTVLLESGGRDYDDDTQRLYAGDHAGVPYMPLDGTRLRYLGGSSNHWGGQSHPFDPEDFQQREWIPHSGWSIDYDDYRRYVPRAQALCGLGDEPFPWAFWKMKGVRWPLEETEIEPILQRYPKTVPKFGEVFANDLAKARALRCVFHANVLRFVTDPAGNNVTHVDVSSLEGRRFTVQAGNFVLATGGIEICRLLLLSPGAGGMGLGNDHDLVGRFFMEHPAYDTCVVRLRERERTTLLREPRFQTISRTLRCDFRLPPKAQAQHQILNHTAYLVRKPSRDAPSSDAVDALNDFWDRSRVSVERMLAPSSDEARLRGTKFAVHVRLEHAPNPNSRVYLVDESDALGLRKAKLEMHFGDLEVRTIDVFIRALGRAMGQSDVGRIRVTFDPDNLGWQRDVEWQYHHAGGTRMHADPKKGVVNGNLRVHSTSNLYVAGSSVFPTVGHVNPTMNLLALTLRLADHLKAEVKR